MTRKGKKALTLTLTKRLLTFVNSWKNCRRNLKNLTSRMLKPKLVLKNPRLEPRKILRRHKI